MSTPLNSPIDAISVLNLALAAIQAHCSNSDQSASLTVKAVAAIQNATKLENLTQLSYTLSGPRSVNDALEELDQISSQAEAIAFDMSRLMRSQNINSAHYLSQLDVITCRLETAASSIRTILPSS